MSARSNSEEGWPALEKGGFADKFVGNFVTDVGTIDQPVHLWRFEDDADRRNHQSSPFSDGPFVAFAAKFWRLVMTQEVKLMLEAPWKPHL